MTGRKGSALAFVCTLGVLALPASAVAASTAVWAGAPQSVVKKIALKVYGRKTIQKIKADQPDFDAFFASRVTVNAGDTVSFINTGFHTIDIPAKGGRDLPLVVPGKTVTGQNDAAGNPFWFNNKVPELDINPALFKPTGPSTYNGTKRIDTGLPLGSGKPKPLKVTFTKPGTYKFFCDVHPGMVGYVVVKPKGQAVPSARQDAAARLNQVKQDVIAVKKLAATKIPANHISVGLSNGNGVEFFNMFPGTLKIKTGTVVTFSMAPRSREDHTATFGPQSYLTALANAFQGASFPPAGSYPSSPTQPIPENPSSHGNGFANTGILDQDASTKTIPASGRIKFTAPGTYHYICLIHPFMHGTIIVK